MIFVQNVPAVMLPLGRVKEGTMTLAIDQGLAGMHMPTSVKSMMEEMQ